jgi:hypothetical protein
LPVGTMVSICLFFCLPFVLLRLYVSSHYLLLFVSAFSIARA